jgi:prepilin signal peptidase PulO-like enzyme (type II secretory pathway)
MDIFLLQLILPFLFGIVIGSFLNVVSLRFNTGVGVGGRSKCMTCGTTLTWKELVPLFSFLVQKGACRKCKGKISWQYPLVEFLAGAVFVLIFLKFPPITPFAAITTVLYLVASCLLVVMTVYDIKHKILPDQFVFPFAGIALLSLFIGGTSFFHVPGWTALIAGPVLALPFALIWLFSQGMWMGLGDAKLILGIGWILGLGAGINALILSFWIAAIASITWILITYGSLKPRTEVPFGPYLILGMYLVLLFGVQVLDTSLLREILTGYF